MRHVSSVFNDAVLEAHSWQMMRIPPELKLHNQSKRNASLHQRANRTHLQSIVLSTDS
jgi:hypothetical protein